MTQYQWYKSAYKGARWRLRPFGSLHGGMLGVIATVRTQTQASRSPIVVATYDWQDTGNATTNTAYFRSVPRAKRWCEAELVKFWNPPEILP